jgi:BlaR1 peptidase M56/Domain of unknown function (DUF3471)
MLELLVESALRSIVLGGAVWLGLCALRVRNPQLRMSAWTAVLLVSLAMPALTPWMRVTVPIHEPPRLVKISWTNVPGIAPRTATPRSTPQHPAVELPRPPAAASHANDLPAAPPSGIDWWLLATVIYVVIAGAMLLRSLIGLLLMWRVVHAAHPIRDSWTGGRDVRVSDVVTVPVTFASTILLPAAASTWTARKRLAALLHEGSHVANGDFYVLLLAGINRAVFWFNPFTWWLFACLADLAENISDDAAIEGLTDRRRYADILLDVASRARRLPGGLAMARPSTVRRRVQRILAMTTIPARISSHRRWLIAAALVPPAALSGGTVAFSVAHQSAAPPTVSLPLAPTQLDRYVGQFELYVTSVISITRDGGQLFAQFTGQPKSRLTAIRDHEFVNEGGDANLTFVTDGDVPAAEIVLREPNTGQRRAPRIDAAMANAIETNALRRIAAAPDRFRDQTPMSGGKTALRQTIEDLRRGEINGEGMSAQLTDKLRRQLSQMQTTMRELGAVESIFFRGVGPGGYDIYGVKFASGYAEFRIDVAPDGTIEDVNFIPGGDGTLGGIADCALEPTLKPARDTAPIKLSITNRSGAGARLFLLDGAGRRLARGTIENDASTSVYTAIAHPLIITDASEQCREIVLPGDVTRFHIIEPSGASTVRRSAPIPGSDEALQRHIDEVRRGTPDYDRMTPHVAAATRQLLPQQQAILAKLGALRSMSFRGVSPSDNDIYMVQFANGSAEWQIGLVNEGRIASMMLGPQY